MAEIALEGTLADVTSRPVSEVTTVTAKAARPTPVAGGLITTEPVNVFYSSETGKIMLTLTAGVKSWLYLDGDGWSDSVPVIAAEGMTQLWEAVVNGLHLPSDIGDYLGIKDAVSKSLEEKIAEIAANFPFDKWLRGDVSDDARADDMVLASHSGVWSVRPAYAEANKLPEGGSGALTVKWVVGADPAFAYAVQEWTPTGRTGTTWTRQKNRGGEWSQWRPNMWMRGELPETLKVDDMMLSEHSGVWSVREAGAADNNLPEGGSGSLTVQWVDGATAAYAYATQEWTPTGRTGTTWTRQKNRGSEWSEWSKMGGGAEVTAGAGAHAARWGDLIASRGGRIGTGGKAVISLRFDHNIGGFDKNILSLLRERGLPATMACFYDMMRPQPGYSSDDSAAAGKTWADLQNNFHRGVEVFSHSYSHQDAATPQALHREIVESRRMLETQMPDVRVHGWDMPGVTGTQYMAWWQDMDETNTRVKHPVHSLLASTYATWNIDGYGLNTLGVPETRYFGVEKYTSMTQVKNLVEEALRTTTGLTLMMHPQNIGRTGYMSLDTFTQMLDYIVDLRDSGQVMVLSQGGQAVADPSTSWRQSLALKLAGWTGDPTGKVTCTVPLGRTPGVGGGMRELVAEVTGTGRVKLTATAEGVMDVYQTVDVAPGKPGRLQIGVPRRASTLALSAEVVSGSPTITSIGLYGV